MSESIQFKEGDKVLVEGTVYREDDGCCWIVRIGKDCGYRVPESSMKLAPEAKPLEDKSEPLITGPIPYTYTISAGGMVHTFSAPTIEGVIALRDAVLTEPASEPNHGTDQAFLS